MAVKNRMVLLMGKKQMEENRPINASTVARETGLTRQAISKWVRGDVTEFREEIVQKLCRYFKCELGDLLYIDWEGLEDEDTEAQPA